MYEAQAAAQSPPEQLQLDDLQLHRLTRAIRGLSSPQLTWASGYLAGLSQGLPTQAANEQASLTILYASQTGNARTVAEELGNRTAALGLAHRIRPVSDIRPRDLTKERLLVLVTSTQGEGEPPESAVALYRYLHGKGAPSLTGLRYAVFGLGDSSYEHFCKASRDFDLRLKALGAHRLLERVDADLDYLESAERWFPDALPVLQQELQPEPAEVLHLVQPRAVPTHDREHPYRARVLENRPITTDDAVSWVRHIALEIDPTVIDYSPGDSLGVRFRNCASLVERILDATGLRADRSVNIGSETVALADALTERLELTQLHPRFVKAWAEHAGADTLKGLIGDRSALGDYVRQRQVVDLIADFPAEVDAATFARLLRPLTSRLYSIASAQSALDDEIHLAVAPLRFRAPAGERLGGASGYLTQRIDEGSELEIHVVENPAFHLPEDSDTPLVMVGAGTGVAPFRAFLQHRSAHGDRGRNWLVFGNRHFHRDFLYQSDWIDLRKQGVLHRFSPAFSRDDDRRIHVQNRLHTEGAELWRWLGEGARLYVCGAIAMEAGVRKALIEVAKIHGGLGADAAEELVEDLRADGRYLRDIY